MPSVRAVTAYVVDAARNAQPPGIVAAVLGELVNAGLTRDDLTAALAQARHDAPDLAGVVADYERALG